MKKLFALALALVLALSFTACGSNTEPGGGLAPAPSTSIEVNPPTDTPPSDIGDGTGTYEGGYANGLFSGWGVWIYHNFRYEGYFENGAPNGEGTLYKASAPPASREPGHTYGTGVILYGNWVDGLADGTVTEKWPMDNGHTHIWSVPYSKGFAAEGSDYVCGECGRASLTVGPAVKPRGGVPPWADILTQPEISAPAGDDIALPNTPGTSAAPDTSGNADTPNGNAATPPPSSAVPPTSPAPATYSLTIVNQTGKDIGSLTITLKDGKGQGGLGSSYYEDAINGRAMGAGESILAAGESKTYTVPGADGGYSGNVDIKATAVDWESFNSIHVEGLRSGGTFIIE